VAGPTGTTRDAWAAWFDPRRSLTPGNRMAGSGRERNGAFGVSSSDKQTLVHRIADGSRRRLAGNSHVSGKRPSNGQTVADQCGQLADKSSSGHSHFLKPFLQRLTIGNFNGVGTRLPGLFGARR
jgi:hypothetical protein